MKPRISLKLALRILLCAAFVLFFLNADILAQGTGATLISQRNVPVKITKAGSYILTSNLTTTNPNITVISILTDNVVIDLDGFTIKGPGKNAGDNSFGINTSPNGNTNVVIRNGIVTNFGNVGVHLPGWNNRVENMRVSECSHGIYAGQGSVTINCQVYACENGINTDTGSMVINNTVYSNYSGINTWGGAEPKGGVVVIGNHLRLNNGVGISVRGKGCRIEGNTITLGGIGIDLTDGSDNLFAKNFLQGNTTALTGQEDDIDGGSIDTALSNIIIP
jgi:parallel beta-helix repeat protein